MQKWENDWCRSWNTNPTCSRNCASCCNMVSRTSSGGGCPMLFLLSKVLVIIKHFLVLLPAVCKSVTMHIQVLLSKCTLELSKTPGKQNQNCKRCRQNPGVQEHHLGHLPSLWETHLLLWCDLHAPSDVWESHFAVILAQKWHHLLMSSGGGP